MNTLGIGEFKCFTNSKSLEDEMSIFSEESPPPLLSKRADERNLLGYKRFIRL
jgi:hypothetical protein